MKIRDVIKLVESDGWYLARTRGSHRQYKGPEKRGLITIPGKLFDWTRFQLSIRLIVHLI